MADFEIINSNDALESTSRNKINNNFAKAVNKQNTGNDVNDPTSPQDVATKNYVDTLGRDGLINPNFTTPLYVSANSFTVAGDVTSWLRPGRGLVITFQTSGIKRGTVVSLSYSSGTDKTTINTVGDSLVNETITSVLLSLSDLEGSLIIHNRIKPDPNLVLYLPFEEGTGTVTKDLSGWGNHGSLVNGPTWTTGKVGKCLSFDGSDDYVDVGNGASLNITDEITIEAWVKSSSNSRQSIVTKTLGGDNPPQNYHFGIQPFPLTNVPYFEHYDNGWRSYYGSVNVCNNKWHHVVAVVKAQNWWKIYVDGVVDTEGTTPYELLTTTGNLQIGQWSGNVPERSFNGLIDEVRIYNRALSASEIQDHYLNP